MTVEQNADSFRKILARNIALPLIISLVTSLVFLSLIFFLGRSSRMVDHTDQVIAATNQTLKLMLDSETGLRGYVITHNPEFLTPYDLASKQVPTEIRELRDLMKDNPSEVTLLTEIEALNQKWQEFAVETLQLTDDKSEGRRQILTGRGKALTDEARKRFDQILTLEEGQRLERAQHANRITNLTITLILLFGLGSGMVVAYYGRRQLVTLSGSYSEAFLQQHAQNEKLRRQQWIRTAQAELSQKIVSDQSQNEVTSIVMDYLARYLKADVGALYVAEPSGVLKRAAGFGIDGAQVPATINMGERLVGRVVKERQVLEFDDLPENYMNLTTTLGEMAPRRIVVAPLASDNIVEGVIELGFRGELLPETAELLGQISVTVGLAIRAARYREQLEALLREVQNQAEELQTQQEELRVSNEEMEVQTRVLKETQSRLEAQHAELEQTNSQLEEQAQTLENQKDSLNRQNDDLDQTRRALEAKAHELSKASSYKSEFLANMSHELRTPLNSSLILAKLLADNKEGNLTKQQVEFAQQILSSGNDLLVLISDILDLAKVEAGRLEVRTEEIDLAELKSSLTRTFAPIAKERNLTFAFEVAADVPESLVSDRVRIEQILKNLLSNACKFTHEGGVTIRVTAPSAETLAFAVADTGIGIPIEKQNVIFEAFKQADGTTSRRFGGTGLGLSISRELCRLLGGALQLSSVPSKGSTFTLTLPRHFQPQAVVKPSTFQPETSPSTTPSTSPLNSPLTAQMSKSATDTQPVTSSSTLSSTRSSRAVRPTRPETAPGERVVLIVEDDLTFSKILGEIAKEMAFKQVTVHSAEAAIDFTINEMPDAVLLDMGLPDHSGLVVLDRLKRDPSTRHIPVHVISGFDFTQTALQMGAVGYALKPVKQEELRKAFELLSNKIGQHMQKILVVEDDQVQRQAIFHLLQGNDVEIEAVGTAGEALKLLKIQSFDCMIMDLNLPDMSGFDLLKKMEQSEATSYPPVIVYTGRDLTLDEEAQLRRHSQSVIVKGARSPERLLNEVTLFLHRVEAQLEPERQAMLQNLRHREKIFEGKSILVADDDMRNVFALSAVLEQKGAHVILAKNGRDALEKLEASPKAVDLVLMDIMMPVMDGYEAMREIRKRNQFRQLPIIALTAKAMKDDRELCLRAGANDYLSKPVDVEKLLSLVRVWISHSGGRQA